MQEPVVLKFGGSSVADIHKLRGIAGMLVQRQASGEALVVVVSAMGKTTDGLFDLARQISEQPSRRELDMLVTAGERISMALLSMAIEDAGGHAISFTGSQSGIITEDAHQGARIVAVRPHRIEEQLALGRIVIVAGYQGVGETSREVTTLGRGGSDTTAVALAAALDASACEIYSDVDGVYSADPNVCPQARLLPSLSYETMKTMAGVGAKVLNAQAVAFAQAAGIRIFARKTGGTLQRQTVVEEVAMRQAAVHAVVGAAWVTNIVCTQEALPSVMAGCSDAGGRVLAVSGTDLVSLWIDRTEMVARDSAPLHALAKQLAASAEDCGLVTVVGDELPGRNRAVLEHALAALQRANMIARGVQLGQQTLQMAVENVDEAVRVLHAALVENAAA